MYSDMLQRRLAFSGAKNLRDLGGYKTTDGRTTRWGVLYRSDSLSKLTRSDLNRLAALRLNRVIDFRSEHELKQQPDRIPPGLNIRVAEISILDSTTKNWLVPREPFKKDNLHEIDSARSMVQTYMELATRFTPQMQLFIRELLSANGGPVLFHCTAGKDRTGFAAAILLRMLGVPGQTVMEDYLLSNRYFLTAHRLNLVFLQLLKGRQVAAMIRGFVEARPAYLTAAFEEINNMHGSFETYVCDGLGLTQVEIERLKALYLQ